MQQNHLQEKAPKIIVPEIIKKKDKYLIFLTKNPLDFYQFSGKWPPPQMFKK